MAPASVLPRFLALLLVLAACAQPPAKSVLDDAPPEVKVVSLSLLDAATGQPLAGADPISEGASLDMAALPAGLNLRANLSGGKAGSVRFAINEDLEEASADAEPFTLVASGAKPWAPQAGTYVVSATPYSKAGGSGHPGPTFTVRFSFAKAEAPPPPPPPDRHYLYSVVDNAVLILDIDDGHKLVRTMAVPPEYEMFGIRGVAANAESRRLYVSYRGSRYQQGESQMLALDLVSGAVAWHRANIQPSVDSLAVTPDGRKLYVATGEERSDADWFLVLDASDGREIGRITVHPNTHNTITSLDGSKVFMSSVTDPYLTVADTVNDQVIDRVGPFSEPVRPFVVNGDASLVFANVEMLIGFEAADLRTGELLYRAEAAGENLHLDFPPPPGGLPPSHGVALSPDEREVWVADFYNSYLHVFDVSSLPAEAPAQVASIELDSAPKWISFSRDGRYVYVAATEEGLGYVLNAESRSVVTTMPRSRHGVIQVDFDAKGEHPTRAYSRYGVGYGKAPQGE
jgi:DNA-binding beta-propeller fold protein YncE